MVYHDGFGQNGLKRLEMVERDETCDPGRGERPGVVGNRDGRRKFPSSWYELWKTFLLNDPKRRRAGGV